MKGTYLLSLAFFAAAAGCSGGDKSATTPSSTTGTTPAVTQDVSKLKIETITPGTGKGAENGDTLTMLYRGTLMNGTEFDGNMDDSGKPNLAKDTFALPLGMGQVIKGWDEGLVGIKEGEMRKLTIPSDLAYGPAGSGEKIPPNSPLIFTVKCLGIVHKGEEMVIDTKDVKVGIGPEVKKGDKISIHYVGTLLNGKKFDSSRDRKKPFEFTVGNAEVVPGVDKGVIGMKKGGIRNLTIPPMAAYGADPSNGLPANAVLKFEIEVLGITSK